MEAIWNKSMDITFDDVTAATKESRYSNNKEVLFISCWREFAILTFVIVLFFIPLAVHFVQCGYLD